MVIREVNDENVKIEMDFDIGLISESANQLNLNSESLYVNQILMQAFVATRSDKQQTSIQIIKRGLGYDIEFNGTAVLIQKSELLGDDIFFFEEPFNISSVYSIATGQLLTLEKGNKNEYFLLGLENKLRYFYQDGILKEFTWFIENTSISFTINPNKN